jgi:hypothetical protein
MTNNSGEAAARSLKVNGVPGKLQIHVNVSYRGLTARTTITQFIIAPPGTKVSTANSGGGHGKLIAVLVIIGGAAAGGAAVALRKGSTSTATSTPPTPPGSTPIGITAGTGTIGGSR